MTLRRTEMAMALRGTETATTLTRTKMATVTKLREGWQRQNVDLQKLKGLGEQRMERENTMDFFLGGGEGGEYASMFEAFLFLFF
jgi:hypothetical protein